MAAAAKVDLGTKRTCPECNTRFYDLGEDSPVTCIECAHVWTPEPVLKSKQPLPFDSAKTSKEKAAETESLEEDDLDIDEDDEGSPDDENDLGGDEDLSEVAKSKGDDEQPET
ncbi:TIGR02300 family protein [Pacificimonas sp. WHA3]|uniref:TIGR02300 family protein n=1 Tax=Pacificimonas pallii TaxID=2827236 RepID=A0ABS6SGM3_9SPHN|nr:TIGR02300 family protein [Pacificimonas pallii]MBV7257569.1 TIGR02300 family protein [Pacificimonas pallii]